MKSIFTLIFCSCTALTYSQAPSNVWAKSFAGLTQESAMAIAVDTFGNSYTVGYFSGTTDFDPGPGSFLLTAAGLEDAFITKLDGAGNFKWALRLGGANTNGSDRAHAVALDSAGNVYVAGLFTGTADFDPGPATFNLSSTAVFDEHDAFILKLDSSANFVWAKDVGGSSFDLVNGITTMLGNVYVTGNFRSTVDFDPGPGVSNFTSAGQGDAYILKLTMTGNFVWARTFGGTLSEAGRFVVADSTKIYVTGLFRGTADFNPGPATFNLVANGEDDAYIVKLDTAGNFEWARGVGGTGIDVAYALALSGKNVYCVGQFEGTVDFDPGAGTQNMVSAGLWDAFLLKLSDAGEYIWAKRFGGMEGDIPYTVTSDSTGVYMAGLFSGPADFDPGSGTANLTPFGDADIFLNKVNHSGNYEWAINMGGPGDDFALSMALHRDYIYTTGIFSSTADFDPGPGTAPLVATSATDSYVSKLVQANTLPIVLKGFKVSVLPDATRLTWVTLHEQNGLYFEVEKSIDGRQFTSIGKVMATGNSAANRSYSYNDSRLINASFYRLKIVDVDGHFTYSNMLHVEPQQKQTVSVYPNPVRSTFNLQLNKPKDTYQLIIYSSTGQVMFSQSIKHVGGYAVQTVQLPQPLPPGYYRLQLKGSDGMKEIISILSALQ